MDRGVKIRLTDKKEYISSNADTLLLSAGLLAVGFFVNGLSALYMAGICLLIGAISEYVL